MNVRVIQKRSTGWAFVGQCLRHPFKALRYFIGKPFHRRDGKRILKALQDDADKREPSDCAPMVIDPARFFDGVIQHLASSGVPMMAMMSLATMMLACLTKSCTPESLPSDLDAWIGSVQKGAEKLNHKGMVESLRESGMGDAADVIGEMIEKLRGQGGNAGPKDASSDEVEKLKRLFGEGK